MAVTFEKPQEPEVRPIQGKQPGSKEEYWVALALWKLKIPFQYQQPLFGGNRLAGGMIVDFVVYNPDATPVEVFGEYWHEGQLSGFDSLKLAIQHNYYGKMTVVLWANDLESPEKTYQVVRRKLA